VRRYLFSVRGNANRCSLWWLYTLMFTLRTEAMRIENVRYKSTFGHTHECENDIKSALSATPKYAGGEWQIIQPPIKSSRWCEANRLGRRWPLLQQTPLLQINQQKRHSRRGNAWNSRSTRNGFWAGFRKLLLEFIRKTFHRWIFKTFGY